MRGKTFFSTVLGAALLCTQAAVGPVRADFTPVADAPGNERSHAEILQHVFSPSQSWHATGTRLDATGNPVDLTNGALTAWRVADDGGGLLDVRGDGTGAGDEVWTGGAFTVRTLARFAGYAQELEYILTGEEPVELFSVQGKKFGATGSGSAAPDSDADWTWARSGQGLTWSSDPEQNADGGDHLVTYALTGLDDGQRHWLLFWEDLPNLGDGDYNDLVVEVTAAVPEPGTVAVLFAGLALALCFRRV
jgi:hypothetical protein